MSGTLYTSWKDALGASHIDEPVAVFENGKIYAAADGFLGTIAKGSLIGEYESGIVYTVSKGSMTYGNRKQAVAVIEDGNIYSISKNVMGGITKSLSVGGCSGGKVYSHTHKIMEGSESFGLYNGDVEGAAAAAAIALFGLDSGVSAYDSSLEDDASRRSLFTRTSGSSGDDSGSGAGCFFTIIVGAIIFAVSILAIIISAIAFVPTFLIYLLVKFIMKRTREEIEESDEQKRKEFIIVLVVSMIIAVVITIVAGADSSDMVLPCIGSGIIEVIGFAWAINAVKKGKEVKFLKRFKKNKSSIRTEKNDSKFNSSSVVIDKKVSDVSSKDIKYNKEYEKENQNTTMATGEKKIVEKSSIEMKDINPESIETKIDNDVTKETTKKTESKTEKKTTGSRLKSTMKTSETKPSNTESDRFKPAGDL